MSDDDINDDNGDDLNADDVGDEDEHQAVTVRDVINGGRVVVDIDAERRRLAAPDGAEISNFDVDVYNDIYALCVVGSGVAVLQEAWKLAADDAKRQLLPIRDHVRMMTIEAQKHWLRNDVYHVDGPRGKKQMSAADLWQGHAQRRQYGGITFHPTLTPPGYYNLFQGFPYDWAVAPDADFSRSRFSRPKNAKVGSCDIFLDHVLINICNGSEVLFNQVIAWAAHMFQYPDDRLGVALALRGGKGTGKTVFGEVLGALAGPYWLLVDHPKYVTGPFNAHMQSLLLLQADEGFWAGNKEAEGALKGLITSREHMIERKGVDAYPVPNFVRLLVTSNEEWVVPASFDERRWMVLDIGEHAKQNREYFAALFAELQADGGGGYAALMRYLMAFDLSQVDLSVVPQTQALIDQKIRSLPPELEWWHSCLWQGWIMSGEWQDEIERVDFYGQYIGFCDQKKINHRLSKPLLTQRVLARFAKGYGDKRGTNDAGARPWKYVLPSLARLRENFEDEIGAKVPWPIEDGQANNDEESSIADS